MDDSKPIFQQVAERISSDILAGTYGEEEQVPSTNEIALFHRINPATAGKGINTLVARGILYKRRGIGMFVATGAREILLRERQDQFVNDYVDPLVTEARAIGFTAEDALRVVGRRLGAVAAGDPRKEQS
ncbi:GntR family transcriptional regulator [Rothia halotolerans]|uniref:GntR family transcriptional regulator n=1 Tax=Rothia halotolerans TaxID=405770 RepID=UPI00101D5024|nr:GntR family transcriptional regulator [Rothia halotolerans]